MSSNKNIEFMGLLIDAVDVDNIDRSAATKVQYIASQKYAERSDASVAQAWIEAVLEYLNAEVKKGTKNGPANE